MINMENKILSLLRENFAPEVPLEEEEVLAEKAMENRLRRAMNLKEKAPNDAPFKNNPEISKQKEKKALKDKNLADKPSKEKSPDEALYTAAQRTLDNPFLNNAEVIRHMGGETWEDCKEDDASCRSLFKKKKDRKKVKRKGGKATRYAFSQEDLIDIKNIANQAAKSLAMTT